MCYIYKISNNFKKMKIEVDENKCVGCGRCTEVCSETFQLNTGGKAEVINQEDKDCAIKAADECPIP